MVQKLALSLIAVALFASAEANAIHDVETCDNVNRNSDKEGIDDDVTSLLQAKVETVAAAERAVNSHNAGQAGTEADGTVQNTMAISTRAACPYKCNAQVCGNQMRPHNRGGHNTNRHTHRAPTTGEGTEVQDAPTWTNLQAWPDKARFCKEKYAGVLCYRIRERRRGKWLEKHPLKDQCESCVCTEDFEVGERVKRLGGSQANYHGQTLKADAEGKVLARVDADGKVMVRFDGHPPIELPMPAEKLTIIKVKFHVGQTIVCHNKAYKLIKVMGSGSKVADAAAYLVKDAQGTPYIWKKTDTDREEKALNLLKGAEYINQIVETCNIGGPILSPFQGTPAETWDELKAMTPELKDAVIHKLAIIAKGLLDRGVCDDDRAPIMEDGQPLKDQTHNTLIDPTNGKVMSIDYDSATFIEDIKSKPAFIDLMVSSINNGVFTFSSRMDRDTGSSEWSAKAIAAVVKAFQGVQDDKIKVAATEACIIGAYTSQDGKLLEDVLAHAKAGQLPGSKSDAFDYDKVLQHHFEGVLAMIRQAEIYHHSEGKKQKDYDQAVVFIKMGAKITYAMFEYDLDVHGLTKFFIEHTDPGTVRQWFAKCKTVTEDPDGLPCADKLSGFITKNPAMSQYVA